MQETRIQSLGWENLLKKGMATHPSILAWRIPRTEEPGGYSPWGRKESDTTWGRKESESDISDKSGLEHINLGGTQFSL